MSRRVLIVGNSARSVLRFRLPLLRALSDSGYSVSIAVPNDTDAEELHRLGFTVVNWRLDRKSLNPVRELISLIQLVKICRRIRPDVSHQFAIKPCVYGTMASALAQVPYRIASLTGLGDVYIEDRGSWGRVRRWLVSTLLRVSLKLSSTVIFQNRDDVKTLFGRYDRAKIVQGGSGVNVEKWTAAAVTPEDIRTLKKQLRMSDGDLVVLMVARLLSTKGVREFVDAGRAIRTTHPHWRFLLVGSIDEGNPSAIEQSVVDRWTAGGEVDLLGEREDIKELMALADVVVLPSYREGFPRALIEAAAMGKPIVATDVPGCREVVVDGQNGLLVPARDCEALKNAIVRMLDDAQMRETYGAASRQRAVRLFDEKRVADAYVHIYRELLGPGTQQDQ